MRHLALYFAIGFVIVGCLMFYTNLSTFISMVLHNYDPFAVVTLAMAMLLPFLIAVLSWRDWREIQGKKGTQREDLETRAGVLWTGKPWILPGVVARSMLVIVAAVVVFWLEFFFGIAGQNILNIQLILWTGLVIFSVWVLSLTRLLSLRASNDYILRNDGLEIRVGILSSKSFAIAPAGFSDLEVSRSIFARIVNSGDIIIRTQGERDIRMERVGNPLKVADQIREVMARPIVRLEGQEQIGERAQKHQTLRGRQKDS